MEEGRGGGLIVGRVFLSALFLHDGFSKLTNWSESVQFMTEQGLPMVGLILGLSVAIEILAGPTTASMAVHTGPGAWAVAYQVEE